MEQSYGMLVIMLATAIVAALDIRKIVTHPAWYYFMGAVIGMISMLL